MNKYISDYLDLMINIQTMTASLHADSMHHYYNDPTKVSESDVLIAYELAMTLSRAVNMAKQLNKDRK